MDQRKPITALRRCSDSLETLQAEVKALARQLHSISQFADNVTECRRDLDALSERFEREMIALRSSPLGYQQLMKARVEQQDREREAHVREELFNYAISHPQEDE
jgi:hypothetical protein